MEFDIMSGRIRGSKIRGEFNSEIKKESNVKIKRSRVRRRTDKELEREAVQEENISILAIVLIVILFCIIGVCIGMVLYKVAINSSNAMIVNRFLFR